MKPAEVLNSHKIKRTSCREGIIEVVMSSEKALSEGEIREKMAGNYDRTTLYRSFKTLEEHKIIHKVFVDNHLVKYAFNNSWSSSREHAHFFCNGCNTVKCVEPFPGQKYHLPEGYVSDETEIIIKGICAGCRTKMHK